MPDSQIQAVLEQFRAAAVTACQTSTALYRCLILSASPARREFLARAAIAAGWEAVLCADVESARAHVRRMFLQLAMIDLENPGGDVPRAFREVVADIAGTKGILAVVCGHEGDIHEEIWARQLGVWLYLPGVGDGDDISLLCSEARQIAERLAEVKSTGPQKPTIEPIRMPGVG